MKRYRLKDLIRAAWSTSGSALIPGKRLAHGGCFHAPGGRTHAEGEHRHDNEEVFCFLQGKGVLELDGKRYPVRAGDVIVICTGEEHYIYADAETPTVNCWFHATDAGNPKQYPAG